MTTEPDKTTIHEQMTDLLARLAPDEGYTDSLLEGVRFLRASPPLTHSPVLCDPSIIIVFRECDPATHYLAGHYTVLPPPSLITEIDTTAGAPLLALCIRLDMAMAADLVMTLHQHGAVFQPERDGIALTPLDPGLSDIVLRLLHALASPLEAQVLAGAIVRELCFRTLLGQQGSAIHAAVTRQRCLGIARALRRIHTDYAQPLDVASLAREAGLSQSSFHLRFKAFAKTSPLQYIKSLRLHQARLLMIRDKTTAAAAAVRVGYESASHFNREFKRLFGRNPGEEARDAIAQAALTIPSP